MIGVVAKTVERAFVREFFELFKTPWEFCREDRRYRVVVHADPGAPCPPADLAILYGSAPNAFDEARMHLPAPARPRGVVAWKGQRIPLYGLSVTFAFDGPAPEVLQAGAQEAMAIVTRGEKGTVVRVGYDLFDEVRALLATGQPPEHAAHPSLERHIDLLRHWILDCGIPLVEIPPVPEGHPFSVCLTHDLDHPSVRLHMLDRTAAGFLRRATLGTLRSVWQGRVTVQGLCRNLGAALRLPFVHLGWAEDFWATSGRYLAIEKGLASTFFALPRKGDPGRTATGPAPLLRAAGYDVKEIGDQLQRIVAAGGEVGVHGIDAWIDTDRAVEEREAVARVAGVTVVGTRMHWLYWDERSPERLEEAGFAYDSTVGYNEAVGFRAGTLQVFKPLNVRRLLELPLHVMDTALFFPSRLDLDSEDAHRAVWPLIVEAERHGGALTINWHDRSIAPERLWDGFYFELLDELKRRRPWFATAAQAVAWFQQRRAARFTEVREDDGSVRVRVSAHPLANVPRLTVRVHTPDHTGASTSSDLSLRDSLEVRVAG